MRILLLTDGIYPFVIGGMQKHSYNLCKQLAQQGNEITLFHSVESDKELPISLNGFTESEMENIQHTCVNFPKLDALPGHYLRESFGLSKLYLEALKQEGEFDVVYAQGFTAWALLKARNNGFDFTAPIIVNFHGLEMFQKAASIKMKLEHYLLRPAVKFNLQQADKVISLGGKLNAILNSIVDKEKIIQSPVGIDRDWINENISSNVVRQLVFIGRNERRKGIKELNQVVKRLRDLNFHLHIIGPFAKEDQLIDVRVTYYGEIKEEQRIKEILDKMDVLVLPSWSEGMPTVILEAMAKGCAIVANEVGAVSELVDDSVGWLCVVGDENSLEKGVRKSINTSTIDLDSLKRKAIKRISEIYSWDNVANKLLGELDKTDF